MELKKQPRAHTDEQKAGILFTGMVKMVQGQPGHVAMTAAVNLAVYGAKGVGLPLEQLIEAVRTTWEKAGKQPGG